MDEATVPSFTASQNFVEVQIKKRDNRIIREHTTIRYAECEYDDRFPNGVFISRSHTLPIKPTKTNQLYFNQELEEQLNRNDQKLFEDIENLQESMVFPPIVLEQLKKQPYDPHINQVVDFFGWSYL